MRMYQNGKWEVDTYLKRVLFLPHYISVSPKNRPLRVIFYFLRFVVGFIRQGTFLASDQGKDKHKNNNKITFHTQTELEQYNFVTNDKAR